VPLVKEIGKYALLGQGKRLRPLIFVLSCRLCGFEDEDVYALSTVFEFIHTSSLLHDDVLDNAETRRKKPSINRLWVAGEPIVTEVYPAQIAFNVVAQIGSEANDLPGYTSEEAKLGRESRKILSDESIKAVSTCVRVPVFNGHSEAIHVEFNNPITPERAREVLAAAPGVQVVDDLANSVFPDTGGFREK